MREILRSMARANMNNVPIPHKNRKYGRGRDKTSFFARNWRSFLYPYGDKKTEKKVLRGLAA